MKSIRRFPNTKVRTGLKGFAGNPDWNEVVLHSTTIVNWDESSITLNSGGWQTPTTKRRMNEVSEEFDLGFRVWQEDLVWYVSVRRRRDPLKRVYEFEDGMTIFRESGSAYNPKDYTIPLIPV